MRNSIAPDVISKVCALSTLRFHNLEPVRKSGLNIRYLRFIRGRACDCSSRGDYQGRGHEIWIWCRRSMLSCNWRLIRYSLLSDATGQWIEILGHNRRIRSREYPKAHVRRLQCQTFAVGTSHKVSIPNCRVELRDHSVDPVEYLQTPVAILALWNEQKPFAL